MKPLSPSLLFLFALTTPSVVGLPFAVARPVDKCVSLGSCRPTFRDIISLGKSRSRWHMRISSPRDPHFPPHQLQPSGKGSGNPDNKDILVQPTIKTAIIHAPSHNPSLGNAALAAILDAAEKDRAAAQKHIEGPPTKIAQPDSESVIVVPAAAMPTSLLARLREADAKRFGHAAGAKETVNRVAGAMHRTRDYGHREGRMWVASKEKEGVKYMYAVSYVKRDYKDALIVGIMILFILAIILVEALEKVARTFRCLLGLKRRGAIRLEDERNYRRGRHCHCREDVLPFYTRGDGSFYTQAATAELTREMIGGGER